MKVPDPAGQPPDDNKKDSYPDPIENQPDPALWCTYWCTYYIRPGTKVPAGTFVPVQTGTFVPEKKNFFIYHSKKFSLKYVSFWTIISIPSKLYQNRPVIRVAVTNGLS